jgi:3-phenylpropionate/trans-cinnamate dioxygenase ferredoxin reductase subunit
MPASRAVIVGASLAGSRAAEALRREGHDGPITIIGAETHLPYDRPPLSKQVLTRKVEPEAVALRLEDDLDVDWMLGTTATGLDLQGRVVVLGGGETVPYDLLVLATGATPRTLPSAPPGPGVHYLRTLDDSIALRDDLARSKAVVVIGAGFIGLEVASSAMALGLRATVLEALPVPLERAIGPEMGSAVTGWHRRKGVEIRTGVAVESVVGASRPEGVRLADGSVIAAEVVVVGVGVRPDISWLNGSGVDLGDGILCDAQLRVLAGGRPMPNVVAAGDAARWSHPAYAESARVEHWTNAADQGDAAAVTLLRGDGAPPYAPVPYFWSDQHGAKLQFVGETRPGDQVRFLEGGFDEERFVAAYGRAGRLVAALGMRRPAKVMALQRLIADGSPFPPEG